VTQGISHINPYAETAMKYRQRGWFGPIPLPHKEKHPPPSGWTGHNAEYPPVDKISDWSSDGKRHNIGLRIAGVDQDFEVVGIDVDHYQKGDKDKRGGDQLSDLEAQLGVLPDTWISSARTDGRSGIRYFRVPRGLAFRGQVDKDIECISKGYRFAVVWPSVHPDGGTYWWFPPGLAPNEDNLPKWEKDYNKAIPNSVELPELPKSWLDHLTQGGMKAKDTERIDLDSSVNEVVAWAEQNFNDAPPGMWADSDGVDQGICSRMQKAIDDHTEKITEAATSHDKIVNAHYNIFKLALEGHCGCDSAVAAIDKVFIDVTLSRDKRGIEEVRNEIFRSCINALRKVKAESDARVAIGAASVDPRCDSTSACVPVGDGTVPPDMPLAGVPQRSGRPVGDYEANDEGNAQHFYDLFSKSVTEPSFRWVEGYGWIVWHEGEFPHWERDQKGELEMRRMFQVVKTKQVDYAEGPLYQDYQAKLIQFRNQNGNVTNDDVRLAKAKYDKWKKFSEQSGNNRGATNAIAALKNIPGVSISINDLDRNAYVLGATNGVVELDGENVRLRPPVPRDYITLSTGVDYEIPSSFATEKWQEYLNTFIPDSELQKITQIILGHCIVGGNPEKIMIVLKGGTNTGKSTMISCIQSAMGDYAQTVGAQMLGLKAFNDDLYRALNSRFVVCSEFSEEDRLNAAVVKRVTGGSDEVSISIKYSMESLVGIPQFKVVLATNETPRITGADKALEQRLRTIPFDVQPKHIDKTAANVLRRVCGTAVLKWLVDGYVEYRRLGFLPTHQLIEEATEEFMAELDDISNFVANWLVKVDSPNHSQEPEWCVARAQMYQHYLLYCEKSGIMQKDRLTPHMLTKRLAGLGIPGSKDMRSIGNRKARWWYGVKLTTAADVMENVVISRVNFAKQRPDTDTGVSFDEEN
jgi:putative DNA primase/helicase